MHARKAEQREGRETVFISSSIPSPFWRKEKLQLFFSQDLMSISEWVRWEERGDQTSSKDVRLLPSSDMSYLT
jgi:hypothetical protein